MRTADIVVVGGGVIGTAVAYAAARDGMRTLLIEQGRVAEHASKGSMGGLHWVHMPNDAALDLAHQGFQRYGTLADELGVPFGLKPITWLGLVLDPGQLPEMTALADHLVSRGFPLRFVDVEEAARMQPGIVWDGVCAVISSEIAHVDVPQLTRAYAATAERHGGSVEEDTALEGVRLNDTGDRVEVVHTSRGPISCDCLVMAAGAWSRRLIQRIGGPTLPIYYSHSQYADARATAEDLSALGLRAFISRAGKVHEESGRACALPPAVDRWEHDDLDDIVPAEHDFCVVPMADGGLRIGQLTRMVPGFFDRVTPEHSRSMVDQAAHRVPALRSIHHWEAGVRAVAFTPDGNPVVGFLASPSNVFVCAGFISPLILIPALADHVSQSLQTRTLAEALRAFSPESRTRQTVNEFVLDQPVRRAKR
ncbi:MAG: NAD(P)/FAD-dependent oxidoreductase [Armatimonadota bacterium]